MESGLKRAQDELMVALDNQMKLGHEATEDERKAARDGIERARQGIIDAAQSMKSSMDSRMRGGASAPSFSHPGMPNMPTDTMRMKPKESKVEACPSCGTTANNWKILTRAQARTRGVEKDSSGKYRVKTCLKCNEDFEEMSRDELLTLKIDVAG